MPSSNLPRTIVLDAPLPDFLHCVDFGAVRFVGHRIGLEQVVYLYKEGYSPEMLAEHFPTLSLSLVHKAIAFYLDHRAAVDRYVAESEADADALFAQHQNTVRCLVDLKRRLELRNRSESKAHLQPRGT